MSTSTPQPIRAAKSAARSRSNFWNPHPPRRCKSQERILKPRILRPRILKQRVDRQTASTLLSLELRSFCGDLFELHPKRLVAIGAFGLNRVESDLQAGGILDRALDVRDRLGDGRDLRIEI